MEPVTRPSTLKGGRRKMTTFVMHRKTVADIDTAESCSVLAYLCTAYLRPFSVIEGDGFKKAAQFFISVGHKYGNVNIKTTRMVQLPATAAIEYVAACWVSRAGEFLSGGAFVQGVFCPGGLCPFPQSSMRICTV